MFDRNDLDTFDDVTPAGMSGLSEGDRPTRPVKRRKRWAEKLRAFAVNLLVGVPGLVVAVTIAAEGARGILDVTQMKLFRLPLPLIAEMERYQGFRDLDLAFLISGLLTVTVTFVWIRIITELKGFGSIVNNGSQPRVIVYLYAGIAGILIAADAFLFFSGLSIRGGGWGEMPAYIPFVCTALYQAAVAAFAIYHSDYLHSDVA